MELEERERNLRNIYNYAREVCLRKSSKRYKGLKLDDNWHTFEDFVKDNRIRYYRAIIKWKNYKKLDTRKGREQKELKNSKIRFVVKDITKGYTKDNTVFTSPSDMTKYTTYTHKYMFEDKLLGTRDIQNILKNRDLFIYSQHLTLNIPGWKRILTKP